MKNWAVLGLLYDFHPSPYNYIKFKYYHFYFCKKDDPTITASLYLDNLAGEIKNYIAKEASVNKKTLTIAVIKKILENKEAKLQMILLFNKKQTAVNKEEIKQFLNQVNLLLNPSTEPELIIQDPIDQSEQNTQPEPIAQSEQNTQPELIADKEEHIHFAKLYARTYLIAAHIYLEINNNESHYEALIQDIPGLKKFISAKFKIPKIAGTIDDMRGYSYKTTLSGRHNNIAKGQLKPLFNQIVQNPAIFGADVSAFAANVLKSISGQ